MDTVLKTEFRNLLQQKNIPDKIARWHMNRVQDFERFISHIPLQECTQQHIRDYLSIKSQGKNIKDRQIARMDESLRLLFAEYFRLPWAENRPVLPANAASPPPSATFQNSGRPGFKDIINAGWKTAMTSAPSRNCSAIRMYPPP